MSSDVPGLDFIKARAKYPSSPSPIQLRVNQLSKFGVVDSLESQEAKRNKGMHSPLQSSAITRRNLMLSQIQQLDDPTKQRYRYAYRRNLMLNQIRQLQDPTTTLLSPLKPEQRYIFSPHDDTGNLYDNALGMSRLGIEKGFLAIRPVFKNEAQRQDFHERIKKVWPTLPYDDHG